MKRFFSAILVILLMLPIHTAAFAASTVITAEVPAPSYELSIIKSMELGYGDKGADMSAPEIINSSGFKEGTGLKVSISYSGAFTCEGVETTIPYTFALVTSDEFYSGNYANWQSGDCLYYYRTEDGGVSQRGCRESGENVSMLLTIVPGAWEAVLPGKYATTINYDVSFITP